MLDKGRPVFLGPTFQQFFRIKETTKDLTGEPAETPLSTPRTYLNRAAELQPSKELQMEIDRLAEEIEAWASSSG